jgi:Polyketide cyclase / dehydrase and lipid transport
MVLNEIVYHNQRSLLEGNIVTQTQSHTAWGGSVTAYMYLPLHRSWAWQQLTNYPRWVEYFPDILKSEVLPASSSLKQGCKRLYQVAGKAFLFFTAQVEIHLQVVESLLDSTCQRVSFYLEQGSFTDFTASMTVQDWEGGTLLTYSVQATPIIPVPTILVEQAMKLELPANMRMMRQVLQR